VKVQKIAAFTKGAVGGNPAGVALCSTFPADEEMQRIAAEVGFSETVFAVPEGLYWRVRYFAPEMEVPFCGHATIALGAALASRHGSNIFPLLMNQGSISVESNVDRELLSVALQSPQTGSRPASRELVNAALCLFSLSCEDLDPRIAPAIANSGQDYLVLALSTRGHLRGMAYDFASGRELMIRHALLAITLVYAEADQLLHVRSPFASGGIYEDAATGAAAAALAGLLRDISWPHHGHLEIHQGDDMGVPSRLHVEISSVPGESIRVSGTARFMN
jgi:PhzF family phenazine biosynthesis protein